MRCTLLTFAVRLVTTIKYASVLPHMFKFLHSSNTLMLLSLPPEILLHIISFIPPSNIILTLSILHPYVHLLISSLIQHMQFHHNILVSGSLDGIRVWNVRDSSCVKILHENERCYQLQFEDKVLVYGHTFGFKVWYE